MKKKEPLTPEDFIVDQFADMRKVNSMARKMFDIYYVDTSTVTDYPYYAIIGKSSIEYIERIIHIAPYTDSRGKLKYEIGAYGGLCISPDAFHVKSKNFRKTKLEASIVMGERDGNHFPQSLILKEHDMGPNDELIIPYLILPDRTIDNGDAYYTALNRMTYNAWYSYLPHYLNMELEFFPIDQHSIEILKEEQVCDIHVSTGDVITLTKDIIPTVNENNRYSLALVNNSGIDPYSGKRHYILKEAAFTDLGSIYIESYTLFAILSML